MSHWHLKTLRHRLRSAVYEDREAAAEERRKVEVLLKQRSFRIVECQDPICRFADVADQAELDADYAATAGMSDAELEAWIEERVRR